ncbi:MAG: hypothetical protein GYB67_14925 [Chloroflexi bacterium]|nr:hypothetical protein [Chloroflexota bacterium]
MSENVKPAPVRVKKADLLATLPPIWPDDPVPQIQAMLREQGDQAAKVVVLDDDPTGTGTINGVPALTEWSVDRLAAELTGPDPTIYLVVNTRAMPPSRAEALNAEVGRNLAEASRLTGRPYVVISRSDSTLRGHYPNEVDALRAGLAADFDVTLINPAFFPGGRLTIGNVHYVTDGEWLVPCGDTEFARDASFGYQASNLREWVEEKTDGQIKAGTVAALSLDLIRTGGPDAVADYLLALDRGMTCIINAAVERDLAVVVLGILRAEAQGRRFMYRTAASIVPLRAGIESKPLLTLADLALPDSGGGLVVVGSYVPKSTAQVNCLLEQTDATPIEIRVRALLADDAQAAEIERVARAADAALTRGEDVVIYTSRELVTGADAESSLSIGTRISESVTAIVSHIRIRPRYLLPKGGITSSDVATVSCGVKRAMVLGQILPGVPVWRLGDESRYPGLVYIIFPGNVGDACSIADVVNRLKL